MKKILLFSLLLLSASLRAQSVSDSIVSLVPKGAEVYRWGYSHLSASDQQLYDTIVGSLLRFEANNFQPFYYHRCDLPGVPITTDIQLLISMLERISRDIPEAYILSSSIPRDYDGMYYARVGYVNTPESYLRELRELALAADTILAGITPGMTPYEQLLELHDGFIRWGDYGGMTDADAGNIRGALLKKKAVCEGFARAGLYLCQRIGIPCIFVSGQLQTSSVNDTWGNHAWNFVELDGEWYLMDLTSDGGFYGIVGHDAFLRGADYFSELYRLDGEGSSQQKAYGTLPSLAATTFDPEAHPFSSLSPVEVPRARKQLIDGRVVIVRNGRRYSVLGQAL